MIVSKTSGKSVYCLKNNGGINLYLQLPTLTTLNNSGGVAIADNNGDDFNDVISTSYDDGKLVWFAISH